ASRERRRHARARIERHFGERLETGYDARDRGAHTHAYACRHRCRRTAARGVCPSGSSSSRRVSPLVGVGPAPAGSGGNSARLTWLAIGTRESIMEFDNSFEVPLPPARAWKLLLDVERIAPCMPGAELTEVGSKNTYKGKIGVRLGPVALTFAVVVKLEDIDDSAYTARVAAQGTDAKGRGGASAASVFHLEPAGSGSKVMVHTNLTLSGSVAQYGRGVGIIQATATQIMNQFATALKEKLGQEQPAAAAPTTASAAPAAAPALPAAKPS